MTAQSTPRLSVAVQSADFDLNLEYTALLAQDRGIGAIVAFVGTVRDLNLAQDVVALELEHYPGMTEKSLQKILDAATERWSLQGARIVHRIGKMYPGDQIVLASNTSVIGNISSTTTLTGTPVTNLVYEDEVNESKRRIKILKASYIDAIVSDFKKKLSE